jgi:hypothetical protein
MQLIGTGMGVRDVAYCTCGRGLTKRRASEYLWESRNDAPYTEKQVLHGMHKNM